MADRTPRSIQNPDSVRRALREFDELGREAFLAKYQVGSARKFELVDDGRGYDAKAVLAAAFAYEFSDEQPLATTEFDGNELTVRGNLERLGFTIRILSDAENSASDTPKRSINEITRRESVVAAVAEYDRLGQDAFLEMYGFAMAQRFFVELDGRRYDSKAIVGAAYGYEFPDRGPLRPTEFSGGAATVQPLLERLGFTVVVEDATSDRGYWWVNQGGSFQRAREEGIVSAPVSAKDGGRPPTHWSNMARLREGDVVLHYKQKSLRAVGRVLERARETDRPLPGYSDQTEHVRQARVEYFELDPPVALEDIPMDWRLAESKPFMRAGGRAGEVNQGYLYPVSAEFVEKLGSRFPSIADRLKYAAAFRRLPRRWCIYVPRSGAENLRIGRREGVWGVPKAGRLDGLQEGDEVLLVHDRADDGTPRPSSLPRVSLSDLHGRAATVVTTVATSDPYYDDTPVWPDAAYPRRFRFLEEGAEEGVLMNAETQPPDVLDAIRRSALEGGRPMPVDGEVIPLRVSYEEPNLSEIAAAVAGEGLRIDPDVLRRYHLSLKTRGFVILSGLSGSGKTWLTSAYARAVGAAYQLAPVAPNWTTNEDLLGYFNPLDHRYVDTPFSRFLRDAAAEAAQAARAGVAPRPYHLVLDEMNLARVEYYFAKFLSAMELRARSEAVTIELGPGEHVAVPGNLMFLGTVNVDETTHQFADKVYDRAQLIELGITEQQVEDHLGDVAYAETVLDVWRAVQDLAPFAFRTLDEISAYIAQAELLGVSWETALDEQLLQKVLPKVKGANPRIGEVLDGFLDAAAEFPLSRVKAIRMREDFGRFGIASYF